MSQMVRVNILSVINGLAGGVMRFFGMGRFLETFLNREFYQHYGFTSQPLPGASGVALVQGNTVVMIATEDTRHQISLAPGEVCIHDWLGSKVHLKAGGEIEISAVAKVVVTAPEVEINGNLAVTGNITATGTIIDAAGNTPNHTHP